MKETGGRIEEEEGGDVRERDRRGGTGWEEGDGGRRDGM